MKPKLYPCAHCGADAVVGTTCPLSIECPACTAGPGSRCKRPSGHEAQQLHMPRVLAAEHLDRENGLAPEDLDPTWLDRDGDTAAAARVAKEQLTIEEAIGDASA